jgi:hypothetical protein
VGSGLARTELGGLVGNAATTLDTTAAHAPALAATLEELPRAEAEAAATLPGAQRLLDTLTPTMHALEPGVAALPAALDEIRAIERDAPALDSFARLGEDARPLIDGYAPVAAGARGPVAALAPLAGPAAHLGQALWPYRDEIVEAPAGFTRWGDFKYDFGQGAGHRAVRFSMIFTCARARNPYPAPGAAGKDRELCR